MSAPRRRSRPIRASIPVLAARKATAEFVRALRSHLQVQPSEQCPSPRARDWFLDNHYLIARQLQRLSQDLPPGFLRRLAWDSDEPRRTRAPRTRPSSCWWRRTSFRIRRASRTSLVAFPPTDRCPPRNCGRFQLYSRPRCWSCWCVHCTSSSRAPLRRRRSSTPLLRASTWWPKNDWSGRCARCNRWSPSLGTTSWSRVARWSMHWGDDPSGTYACMDRETRDRYRREVEDLALRAGRSELEMAQRALDLARSGRDARTRHVGYWLIGEGRPRWEAGTPYARGVRSWMRRLLLCRPGHWYAILLSVSLLASLVVPGASLWHATSVPRHARAGPAGRRSRCIRVGRHIRSLVPDASPASTGTAKARPKHALEDGERLFVVVPDPGRIRGRGRDSPSSPRDPRPVQPRTRPVLRAPGRLSGQRHRK